MPEPPEQQRVVYTFPADDWIEGYKEMERENEKLRETCLICGHLWRRHDPEDGMCDAPADGELGACKCGRDIAWMRYKISKLSHRALTDGRP